MHPQAPQSEALGFRRSQDWPTKEEFTRRINFAAQLFQLNPDLPELRALRDAYEDLSVPHQGNMPPLHYLRRLNPHFMAYVHPNGELYISEDPHGDRILQLDSLIRHHIPSIEARLQQVVVNDRGLHLFGYPNNCRLATAVGLHIDPQRLADPGNRYAQACKLIATFTGLELSWRPLVRHTRSITVSRERKRWRAKILPPPARH